MLKDFVDKIAKKMAKNTKETTKIDDPKDAVIHDEPEKTDEMLDKTLYTTGKDNGMLDMVIAFDTTGSMSAYIEDVKKHVKELIPELLNSNPDMRLSIVAFGDYCDMKSATKFGPAYQSIALTKNANKLIDFVQAAKNTSGGDADEFYELVLHKILNETKWRKTAKKTILLIADAQPHKPGYSFKDICNNTQYDWRQEMATAIEMNVEIDTLSLCFYGEDWYKEISEKTNGVYSKFESSGKTSDFIKTAAWSRGGEATSSMLYSMAYDMDYEIANAAKTYMCKNVSAKMKYDSKDDK